MNYSAILVIARPGRLEAAVEAARRINGVEPHQTDPALNSLTSLTSASSNIVRTPLKETPPADDAVLSEDFRV